MKRIRSAARRDNRPKPTVVDLYCGCGGATEAFKRRGFDVLAAVDINPIACETYRLNHPEVHLYERNILGLNPRDIARDVLGRRKLDLMVVCAPCQPFSSQNHMKGIGDKRSELILQTVRFAAALRPKLILFENVAGFATERYAGILARLRRRLEKKGYSLGEPQEIDAADYKVPQRRRRCIMFAGLKKTLPSLRRPITPSGKRVTVRMAIGRFPALKSGQTQENDSLHFARKHSEIALKRLDKIPKNGGSRSSLPSSLVLRCHKNYQGHADVYGRMRWQSVAPTLTTGCTDITRGRFAHPRDNRAISLREAAALQTFPRRYAFAGNPSQIATQIGNAVPVELFKSLVPCVKKFVRPRSSK